MPRRAPLTRDRILDEALALLDAEGAEGLSMRKLAARLGVEAMSLYHHVPSRQALLDAVADRVLATLPDPDPTRPWPERLEAAAWSLYRALVDHPALIPVLASEAARPSSPDVLHRMDAVLAALATSGLSPAEQVSTYRGLLATCFGFALTHTRGATTTRAEAEAVWLAEGSPWDPAAVPHLMALAPTFLTTRPEDDLRFTLRTLIDALASHARRSGRRPGEPL